MTARILLRADPVAAAQLALLLALDASWLWAWSLLAGVVLGTPAAAHGAPSGGSAALVGLPATIGVMALGAALRQVARRRLAPRALRPAIAALGILLAATALAAAWWQQPGAPPPWRVGWAPLHDDVLVTQGVVAALLVLLAWWRGSALPWPRPTLARAEAGFHVAARALALLFLVVVGVPSSVPLPLAQLTAAALVTLFAGLVGMPLARVMDLSHGPARDGGMPLRVSGHWATILIGSVAALLLAAVVAARALVAGLVQWVLEGPLAWVLALALFVLDLPFRLLSWLGSLLAPDTIEPLREPSGTSLPRVLVERPVQQPAAQGSSHDLLLFALEAIAVVGLFVVLTVLISRAASVLGGWATGDGVAEERDFVWPALTEGWLTQLGARLRRRASQVVARVARGAGPPGGPAWRVRLLYRHVQRLGTQAGRTRALDETPREYEAALADGGPLTAGQPDLDLVTTLYTRVRYGDEVPPGEAVGAAESAVERLKSVAARH